MMKLLKGQKIADKILDSLKKKISVKKNEPVLAVILVGNNQASRLYVNLKKKAAKRIGVRFQLFHFSEKIEEEKIIQKIKKLNADKKVSGIIVQLPLPKKLSTQKIIKTIDSRKDVDGFSAQNAASLQPVFPQAIMKILASSRIKLQGKNSIVIANSKIFGETMISVLKNKGVKAEYLFFKDFNRRLSLIKKADIIISAIGKAGLIKDEMIKKGVIIADGGITKRDKKVFGDVDVESVKDKASFLTPVPGGVGPVTVACLLKNTYLASLKK